MLSQTKIFYCLTKNVNLKSILSENLLADFCTSGGRGNLLGNFHMVSTLAVSLVLFCLSSVRLLGFFGLCFRGVVHKVYPGIRVKGVLLLIQNSVFPAKYNLEAFQSCFFNNLYYILHVGDVCGTIDHIGSAQHCNWFDYTSSQAPSTFYRCKRLCFLK